MDASVLSEVVQIPLSVAERVTDLLNVPSLLDATDEALVSLASEEGVGPVYANMVRAAAKDAKRFYNPKLPSEL